MARVGIKILIGDITGFRRARKKKETNKKEEMNKNEEKNEKEDKKSYGSKDQKK